MPSKILCQGLSGPPVPNLGSILKKCVFNMRHRGYDGYGIVVDNGGVLEVHHFDGMVDEEDVEIEGHYGIAHTRYMTNNDEVATQPLVQKGVALVHNGQIDHPDDSQHLLDIFTSVGEYTPESIAAAAEKIHRTTRGSFSCLFLVAGMGIVAVRDKNGIRPMSHMENGEGSVIISSENRVGKMIGFAEVIPWASPGCTIHYLPGKGVRHFEALPRSDIRLTPCLFEFIYLAREDSSIEGINVGDAREQFGEILAEKCRHLDAEVVVPLPRTACVGTKRLALMIGLPYEEIIEAVKPSVRSFIQSTDEDRRDVIFRKFRFDGEALRGRKILLVDDSIVRGNTMRHVVQKLRDLGAKKVSVASLAPPVVDKNVFGIDVPTSRELVACGRTAQEIASALGVDGIAYNDLDEMKKRLYALRDWRFRTDCCDVVDFEDSMFVSS